MTNDPCKAYQQSESGFYQALLSGANQAYSCLYLQTYRQCIPYVVDRGADPDDARDLLQECLAIFLGKIRDGSYVYQEGVRITTYFHRIYINQWKKSLENKSRRKEVPLEIRIDQDDDENDNERPLARVSDPFAEPYDDDERSWIFKKLNRAFGLLAEDCRKMLNWFYVEDRSLREIAAELNMTENSAAVKRFKCAKYLKDKFHLDDKERR